MVKRLFHPENERYTPEALDLSQEVFAAIKPIVDKYADQGYSVREIASIVHSEVDIATILRIV
ncbi:hypothetical protein [Xanthomonas phage BUDD]|nr:hypothetical protein [Xanthomonas phage BUDD]